MNNILNENFFIPISSFQHFLFCPRQFALIHLEQIWEDNFFTAHGKILHERVDNTHHESRKGIHHEFGLPLYSTTHEIYGRADLVEIYYDVKKIKKVVPVEFKRGLNKKNDCDRVQLCAQAFCLEEMFQLEINLGQIFYYKINRRIDVPLNSELRSKTFAILDKMRSIIRNKEVVHAVYQKQTCDRCSLYDLCMPKSAGSGKKDVKKYLSQELSDYGEK